MTQFMVASVNGLPLCAGRDIAWKHQLATDMTDQTKCTAPALTDHLQLPNAHCNMRGRHCSPDEPALPCLMLSSLEQPSHAKRMLMACKQTGNWQLA